MPIMHQKTFQELCREIINISDVRTIPIEEFLKKEMEMYKAHQEYLHRQNNPFTPPDEIILKETLP